MAQSKPSLNGLRSKVWKVETAPKIKIFLWKALSNALGVAEECIARGMKVDPRCQKCGHEGESINHVLFSFPAARLVWAHSGVPFPRRGFEHCSLYENFSYLMNLGKDKRVPKEISRIFPWVLWFLWKNKNSFTFEGRDFDAVDTVTKCREEARRWFEALEAANRETREKNCRARKAEVWKPPERGKVKCNIGLSWIKKTSLAGVSWIVRSSDGATLLHSRRAFNGVPSLLEARRLALIWAAESMGAHKIANVSFEMEDSEVVGVVNKPKAWPALRAYGEELREVLGQISDWEALSARRGANKAAFMIARSVTKERRTQSYVAQGDPLWLRSLLVEEAMRSRDV